MRAIRVGFGREHTPWAGLLVEHVHGPNVTVGAEGHRPSARKESVVRTVVVVDGEVPPPPSRPDGACLGHSRRDGHAPQHTGRFRIRT